MESGQENQPSAGHESVGAGRSLRAFRSRDQCQQDHSVFAPRIAIVLSHGDVQCSTMF